MASTCLCSICWSSYNETSSSSSPSQIIFSLYILLLTLFHFSEFMATALFQPPNLLSLDSFLLNHSREYHIALAISMGEFTLEWLLFPNVKFYFAEVAYVGIVFCLLGETIRKGAMFQARANFTHIIAEEKRPGHRLVKSGFYSVVRHPSYLGWFLWSVGTQVTPKKTLWNALKSCYFSRLSSSTQ